MKKTQLFYNCNIRYWCVFCLKNRIADFACTAAFIFTLAFAMHSHAADVNVLIIGSEYDSTTSYSDPNMWYHKINGDSKPFSAAGIKTELENILSGAGLGTINVQLEERRNTAGQYWANDGRAQNVHCQNLESWYRWPYPAGADVSRWANLRGEGGTDWDFVILIGDPYTIENQPGVYAQGVASIAGEVAKGSGETVLLMPWPAAGSTSSVAHYKEVVYRVGRSGEIKVAPAALAWQAAGSPVAAVHPSPDGTYIAAASIYSSIWGQSASSSSYNYNPSGDNLADTAHTAFVNNNGIAQYSGNFNFNSPFKMMDDKRRKIRFSRMESSTEAGFHTAATDAAGRCGVQFSSNDYENVWWLKRADNGLASVGRLHWSFYYHNTSSNADSHVSELSSVDLALADWMRDNNSLYRLLPRRFLWAQFHQEYPLESPKGDAIHLSSIASRMTGAYMYTLFSGRCPMGVKPNPVTAQWYADKIGYETAWRMGRLQTRAPGFKVLPSGSKQHGVSAAKAETMTVQFILPPKENVTVNVSVSNGNSATVSPATLTFTPENYSVRQQVQVTAKPGAVIGSNFNVLYDTVSNDEVYHGLNDSWNYIVNTIPDLTLSAAANPLIMASGAVTASTSVTAHVIDPDGQPLTYNWEKRYGPGNVSFSSSTITNPTVTFSQPGNYILRCNVADPYSPVYEEISIDVHPHIIVLRNPENPANTVHELKYDIYAGHQYQDSTDDIGDFYGGAWVAKGNVSYFRPTGHSQEATGRFAVVYNGYIEVPENGYYTFNLRSNIGSKLFIGSTLVVDNDDPNLNLQEKSAAIGLKRGKHKIKVKYYYKTVNSSPVIEAHWAGPNIERQIISWQNLYHVSPTPVEDVPLAYDQTVSVAPNTGENITLTASDADGDPISFSVESNPAKGTLSGTAPNLIYTPYHGATGSDSFTFKANDGKADSAIATVSIFINTPPTVGAGPNQTVYLQLLPSTPGLYYGTVPGNINTSTPNPRSQIIVDVSSETENQIGDETTEIYTGFIYDADGQISFTEHIDNKARIWIDGVLVLSNDIWNVRTHTGNLNLDPGWHAFEFRISNDTGYGGPHNSSEVAIGYDPDGGTSWQTLADPGNGTLLRVNATDREAIVSLDGAVTDAEHTPTGSWSVVSGPAAVTFADSGAIDTTATFTVAGTYVLRLTGSDGYEQTTDELTITVNPPLPANYTAWTGGNFANPFTTTGPTDDQDGDSSSNLMEFAFGTDPTLSDSANLSIDGSTHGQPILKPNGATMEFYFIRRDDDSINYTVQFSSDLSDFADDDTPPAFVTDSSANSDYEIVKVPFPAGTKFGRIKLELPP